MGRGSSAYGNDYKGVGTSFQQGFDAATTRERAGKEYRNKVRERRQKEAKELYGQLVVPDTGQTTFDADKRIMAKEWKTQANNLLIQKRNGEISPEEYEQQVAQLTGNAKTFADGAKAFKETIANYRENKDKISEATPTHILDALDTIDKNPDAVTTKNINGVPHLVGETEEGQPIQVPLADIQNGKGAWRFSTKKDITKDKDNILKDLDGFKKQVATSTGVSEQTLGWDQLSERATQHVSNLLQDENDLRSIAADNYGIDYEDFEEMGVDAVRQQVQDQMLSEFESQLVPRQTRFSPTSTSQTARATASDKKTGRANQINNNLHNSLNAYLTGGKELDQAAVDEVFKQIGGNNIKGIKFTPSSGGFLGFGKSDAKITITDKSGKKFDIPADAQGLINIALRTEFGTEVDRAGNQIGGQVQADESNPLGI